MQVIMDFRCSLALKFQSHCDIHDSFLRIGSRLAYFNTRLETAAVIKVRNEALKKAKNAQLFCYLLREAVVISGQFFSVSANMSYGATSKPLASRSMKCNDGCVRPRSSFEIELTSQPQVSASNTCDTPISLRSFLSAFPNASSVFRSKLYLKFALTNIGTYSFI